MGINLSGNFAKAKKVKTTSKKKASGKKPNKGMGLAPKKRKYVTDEC